MNARATIISDASFYDRAKVAAWGAWVKADGRKSAMFSGQIKRACNSSTDAEICALANAVTMADRNGLIDDGMEVMLQSDSASALGYVLALVPGAENRPHETSAEIFQPKRKCAMLALRVEAAGVIAEIAERRRLKIIVRHVRGHRPGDGRQWVNREVDRLARTHAHVALGEKPKRKRSRPKRKGLNS